MTIKELVNKYTDKGYALRDAQNLVAEEIIINKISSSNMAEHVTLKGGIVMYNLTKSNRRVTQDIDFDLIRYSIDKKSINLFVNKLNSVNDGFKASIQGEIENLNQEDYKGVRVHLVITDNRKDSLRIKLDIGVHTYFAIEQEKVLFNFSSDNSGVCINVNPPEQIFAEKLISLARLGAISTRYKDLYDFYYLINECKISPKKVGAILELFFQNSIKRPNTMIELQNAIEDTLNNDQFIKEASKPSSKWIDVDIGVIKNTLLDFVYKL